MSKKENGEAGWFAKSKWESAIALLGLAGTISTLIGFPAVYFQCARLSIPFRFVDYQTVLVAGVVPTLLLGLFTLMAIAVWRQLSRSGRFTVPVSAGVTGILIVLPIVLIAVISVILLVIWLLVAGTNYLFELTIQKSLTSNEVIWTTLAVFALGTALDLIVERLKSKRQTAGQSEGEHSQLTSKDNAALGKKSEKHQVQIEKEARSSVATVAIMWIATPIALYLLLLLAKLLLYFWAREWSILFSYSTLFWIAIISSNIFSFTATAIEFESGEVLLSQKKTVRSIAIIEFVVAPALLYLTFAALYSIEIYPRVDQGLGGGKPQPVSICLADQPKIVTDQLNELPNARVTAFNPGVLVDSIYWSYSNDEFVVLVGLSDSSVKSIALSKSSIDLIIWPPK